MGNLPSVIDEGNEKRSSPKSHFPLADVNMFLRRFLHQSEKLNSGSTLTALIGLPTFRLKVSSTHNFILVGKSLN